MQASAGENEAMIRHNYTSITHVRA